MCIFGTDLPEEKPLWKISPAYTDAFKAGADATKREIEIEIRKVFENYYGKEQAFYELAHGLGNDILTAIKSCTVEV